MPPSEICPCPAHPARTNAAMEPTRACHVDIAASPLRQGALPEDDESLAVRRDRSRHLPVFLVDHEGPPALGVGALEKHLAVRVLDVLDRRLPALLGLQIADLHAFGFDSEYRRKG